MLFFLLPIFWFFSLRLAQAESLGSTPTSASDVAPQPASQETQRTSTRGESTKDLSTSSTRDLSASDCVPVNGGGHVGGKRKAYLVCPTSEKPSKRQRSSAPDSSDLAEVDSKSVKASAKPSTVASSIVSPSQSHSATHNVGNTAVYKDEQSASSHKPSPTSRPRLRGTARRGSSLTHSDVSVPRPNSELQAQSLSPTSPPLLKKCGVRLRGRGGALLAQRSPVDEEPATVDPVSNTEVLGGTGIRLRGRGSTKNVAIRGLAIRGGLSSRGGHGGSSSGNANGANGSGFSVRGLSSRARLRGAVLRGVPRRGAAIRGKPFNRSLRDSNSPDSSLSSGGSDAESSSSEEEEDESVISPAAVPEKNKVGGKGKGVKGKRSMAETLSSSNSAVVNSASSRAQGADGEEKSSVSVGDNSPISRSTAASLVATQSIMKTPSKRPVLSSASLSQSNTSDTETPLSPVLSFHKNAFKVGDVVWAKMVDLPWWPAVVESIRSPLTMAAAMQDLSLLFLGRKGSTQTTLLPTTLVAPFVENFRSKFLPKKRTSTYVRGIQEACELCDIEPPQPPSPTNKAPKPEKGKFFLSIHFFPFCVFYCKFMYFK